MRRQLLATCAMTASVRLCAPLRHSTRSCCAPPAPAARSPAPCTRAGERGRPGWAPPAHRQQALPGLAIPRAGGLAGVRDLELAEARAALAPHRHQGLLGAVKEEAQVKGRQVLEARQQPRQAARPAERAHKQGDQSGPSAWLAQTHRLEH